MVGLGALAVLAVVAAVLAAFGVGGDDHNRPPGSFTTTTAAGTKAGGPDEVAAEQAVRTYYQAVLDKDCPTMLRVASQTVWAADNPGDALAGCQQAMATTDYKARGFRLDGLTVLSHHGDTVSFTTDEQMDGQSSTETVVVTKRDGVWKVDRFIR